MKLKDNKGEAMVVVLAILAIMTALALTLILSAATMSGSAKKGAVTERCRILANSFAKNIEEDILQTDDEKTSIQKYLFQEIFTSKNLKQDNPMDLKIASGETDSTLYEPGKYLDGYNLEVSMSIEGEATDTSSQASYNGIKLTVSTIGTKDGQIYKCNKTYRLLATADTWIWEKEG